MTPRTRRTSRGRSTTDNPIGRAGDARIARPGVVHLTSRGFNVVAAKYAASARRHRLPTIASLSIYARAGLLMSYGPVQQAYFERAVALADKIVKGRKPADLPIEGPDRFEFVINLETARAIGLTIARSLLYAFMPAPPLFTRARRPRPETTAPPMPAPIHPLDKAAS